MPGIVQLPRNYNPWTQALPGMLQNMVLQKLGQKFQDKQSTKRQEFRKGNLEDEQDFFLKTRFDETPQEHVPAGRPGGRFDGGLDRRLESS